MYAHQGHKAIPIIDSLLKTNISIHNSLELKAYKIEALVQTQKLESALNLSNEILKSPNLKKIPLIRTYIERALIYEFALDYKESKRALNFVRDYYKNPKVLKDELYGEYLYRLSSWYRSQKLNKEGFEYAEKGRYFGKKNNYTNVEATSLFLLVALSNNRNSKQNQILNKRALNLWKQSNNYPHIITMYLNLAEYNIKIKKYNKANIFLDSILSMNIKSNDFSNIGIAFRFKSDIHKTKGEFKRALYYYKRFKELDDQFSGKLRIKEVSEINAKFNYEKEELENQILTQNITKEKKEKNYLLIGLLILFVLLFSLGYLAFRIAKKRKEIKIQSQIIENKNTKLTDALDENKLLLKELNHRINNNLALILSLVKFQYYEIDEPKYKEKFQSLEHRIKTIAAAHEQLLYNRENLDGENYDVQEYLSKIVNALIEISIKNIRLNLDAKNIKLNIDTMLPIGILINELMSNSLKHAIFENELIIDINIKLYQSKIKFTYKDSGTSFKETTKTKSLGVSIINSMVKQLKGSIQRKGSEYKISLQLKNSKKER